MRCMLLLSDERLPPSPSVVSSRHVIRRQDHMQQRLQEYKQRKRAAAAAMSASSNGARARARAPTAASSGKARLPSTGHPSLLTAASENADGLSIAPAAAVGKRSAVGTRGTGGSGHGSAEAVVRRGGDERRVKRAKVRGSPRRLLASTCTGRRPMSSFGSQRPACVFRVVMA